MVEECVYYLCCYIFIFFFFSSRRRHTRCSRDWSSDVCSSDLAGRGASRRCRSDGAGSPSRTRTRNRTGRRDRKSTRLNSSHGYISYAVFCLKKKKKNDETKLNHVYTTHCATHSQ